MLPARAAGLAWSACMVTQCLLQPVATLGCAHGLLFCINEAPLHLHTTWLGSSAFTAASSQGLSQRCCQIRLQKLPAPRWKPLQSLRVKENSPLGGASAAALGPQERGTETQGWLPRALLRHPLGNGDYSAVKPVGCPVPEGPSPVRHQSLNMDCSPGSCLLSPVAFPLLCGCSLPSPSQLMKPTAAVRGWGSLKSLFPYIWFHWKGIYLPCPHPCPCQRPDSLACPLLTILTAPPRRFYRRASSAAWHCLEG